MLLIIAFYGPKGSGKSTSARTLEQLIRSDYGYVGGITKLSFAAFYKQIATELGFDVNNKETPDEELGITPREFLCYLGDFFRETLPVTTKRKWMQGSSESASTLLIRRRLENLFGIVIIDDLRYVEEFEMLKKYNTIYVYIRRHAISLESYHSSEREIYKIYDSIGEERIIIANNGSTAELVKHIDILFKRAILKILFNEHELL